MICAYDGGCTFDCVLGGLEVYACVFHVAYVLKIFSQMYFIIKKKRNENIYIYFFLLLKILLNQWFFND